MVQTNNEIKVQIDQLILEKKFKEALQLIKDNKIFGYTITKTEALKRWDRYIKSYDFFDNLYWYSVPHSKSGTSFKVYLIKQIDWLLIGRHVDSKKERARVAVAAYNKAKYGNVDEPSGFPGYLL